LKWDAKDRLKLAEVLPDCLDLLHRPNQKLHVTDRTNALMDVQSMLVADSELTILADPGQRVGAATERPSFVRRCRAKSKPWRYSAESRLIRSMHADQVTAMHPPMTMMVSHQPIESAGMGAIDPINVGLTRPRCGAHTVKGIRWVWLMVAAIFLVGSPMRLLVDAALAPGVGGIRSYDWISAVVMGLILRRRSCDQCAPVALQEMQTYLPMR